MHWKTKAVIQNVIAMLPTRLSYRTYYGFQRKFGGLRIYDPSSRFEAAAEMWERIQLSGVNPVGMVALEVGTGRVPVVPLAFWLMGASRTITIDLHRYVSNELVSETLTWVRENQSRLSSLLGHRLDKERLSALLGLSERENTQLLNLVTDLCSIEYVAPGDAANTKLPNGCIDAHVSFTVLEHIPPLALEAIFLEGSRLISLSGVFVHCVDYTDHFAHSDRKISRVNFLRYSDAIWNLYAGNRYMYMNRLRHDDMVALVKSCGLDVIRNEPRVHPSLKRHLELGDLKVAKKFSDKSVDCLATSGAWIVARKA